tara:strand:- start:201 stop:851 length:651 start_codon:yes stop_codon:yes gene_type:complete
MSNINNYTQPLNENDSVKKQINNDNCIHAHNKNISNDYYNDFESQNNLPLDFNLKHRLFLDFELIIISLISVFIGKMASNLIGKICINFIKALLDISFGTLIHLNNRLFNILTYLFENKDSTSEVISIFSYNYYHKWIFGENTYFSKKQDYVIYNLFLYNNILENQLFNYGNDLTNLGSFILTIIISGFIILVHFILRIKNISIILPLVNIKLNLI